MKSSDDSQPPARVFISATSGDLGTVREIVKQGLLTMNCLPIEQANFTPDYRGVAEMLESRIRHCDAVVHLVGLRYGAEPDPATLPEGAPRRSFTQMEADIARRLGLKLYVFLCPQNFPYDSTDLEPEEKAALQLAYRVEVAGRSTLHTQVQDRHDVAQCVRELQLDFEKLRARFTRQRRRGVAITLAFAVALAGLAFTGWWYQRRTPQMVMEAVEKANTYDPVRIRASLEQQIRARAEKEIATFDKSDWEKIAQAEKTRDQQLADLHRFLDQIARAFEKKEANANFAQASRLLAERDLSEALRFLKAKSAACDAQIAVLKQARDLPEQTLRDLLQEKLLKASLYEQNLDYNEAEAEYRAVVSDSRAWAEPRNRLAWLLIERGETIEPEAGNPKLREAAEICRVTLAMCPRASSPLDWATAKSTLGDALSRQAFRAKGAEKAWLLGEAVTAFREALEVRKRKEFPEDWAVSMNGLANALQNQALQAVGEERARLLDEAVTAYREVLANTQQERSWTWAETQSNLGIVLWRQASPAAPQEAVRLLGAAATAYRAALTVYTQENSPLAWAGVQSNLGIALRGQAAQASGAEAARLQGEAVAAYREALKVYTRKDYPQDWARTQTNLGVALQHQASQADGVETARLLTEAVLAQRLALEVRKPKEVPQAWANTQSNLGEALALQAARASGVEKTLLLGETVKSFREALTVFNREHSPQDWEAAQKNLSAALRQLASLATGTESQKLAAEAEALDSALQER